MERKVTTGVKTSLAFFVGFSSAQAQCIDTLDLCRTSAGYICVANRSECNFPGDQYVGRNRRCEGMRRGCPIDPTDPDPVANFRVSEWCRTADERPADALEGGIAFLDHQGGPNPQTGMSCVYIDLDKSVSKTWCKLTDQHLKETYNCSYSEASPEDNCGGGQYGWPDHIQGPDYSALYNKWAVCVRAYNQHEDNNREFQIFAK